MYFFRNDYSQGAHPKVLEALAALSGEDNIGYGDDPYSSRAKDLIRTLCQCPGGTVEFLIGGTQTNVTACAFLLKPWEAAIAPDTGHLNGHEVGAFEATGHKILTVEADRDGKLRPEQLVPLLERHQDTHLTKPALVYISDATETGAVYTRAELTALSGFCRANGLLLFVDGARLGTALASPVNDVTLPDLARLADAFYIGGTKNGAFFGEALVIPDPARAQDFFRMKKRMGAVLAKGWLQGVQFLALLEDGLYFDIARHANEMAALLQDGLKELGLPLYFDSPTNQIFPIVTAVQREKLAEIAHFEDWCPAPEPGQFVIRFVTSFATPRARVEDFLRDLSRAL